MTAAMPLDSAMPAMPAIGVAGPTSMVQVRNVGDVDFVKEYHVDTIRIPAGSSMIVMWDIMVYWMGNPSLVDANIRQKDRAREYSRLRVLYGAYDDEVIWENNRPRLEVFALTGERIWTVAEDPEGAHNTPASQSVAYAATYEAQIALMQKQIDALQMMMSQQPSVTPSMPATPVAPADQVTGATVPSPPQPTPTRPPIQPNQPAPPFQPVPAFAPEGEPTRVINPADNHGEWVDTTRAPVARPPFVVDAPGPPEDVATGPRIS